MTESGTLKRLIICIIDIFIKPCVRIWFWLVRWIIHNRCLRHNRDASIISLPFVFIYSLTALIKNRWATEFSDYAFKKYSSTFLKMHYAKSGVGYAGYDRLSEAECLKIYDDLSGRIAYYITHNPTILAYKDGDSFLDVGCGKGQNIKELVARYPNSLIKGFDIHRGVLQIIKTALKENTNVHVEVGDVSNLQYLESYPMGAFDHLVISHVFSFLIGPGVEETRKLRQTLIDHFIRIAAKSVLIMDGAILLESEVPEVMIERNSRCFSRESSAPYFSKHISKGELYAMFSPVNKGIIFRLKR